MAEKTTEIASRERQGAARREPLWSSNPFRTLERFADEMETIFDDFGVGRSWFGPRQGRSGLGPSLSRAEMWTPDIEVHQQNHELVVRADLPGLKKDEIRIDVTDNEIAISGERRQEQETEHGGVYRSERRYGSFYRAIPLPEGAMTDQAKATFKDGVLEVRMPAPPDQVTRGRRLEIKEGTDAKK
jgi:HSP20 family protein